MYRGTHEKACKKVGGLRAKTLVLFSPLLKWYIEHGLLVTRIYEVIEYGRQQCFSKFVDFVTKARREGDIDKTKEVIGTLCKLLGNSAFGGTIMCKENFQRISYKEGLRAASFAINDPRFLRMSELGDSFFEVEFSRSNICIDLPLQIGFAILNYAKLYLLSFYYDFLLKYIGRDQFDFMECDTDSTYIALPKQTLAECVLPEKKEKFNDTLLNHCIDNYQPEVGNYLARTCCDKHIRFDGKTPGLVKEECICTKMICLCSKSYVAANKTGSKPKFSLKGVNKSSFVDPTETFERVLKTFQCPSKVKG